MARKRPNQTSLLRYLNAKCENCGVSDNLTVDHRRPLSLRGANDETNIRILCRSCQNKYHGIGRKKREDR